MLRLLQALCLKPIKNAGLHSGIVAKTRKPAHALLSTKPGELAFGVLPRSLLNRTPRLFERDFAAEDCAQFSVADEIEWSCVFAQAAFQQGMNFPQPSPLEHGVCSCVDTLVEFLARRYHANFQNSPSWQWGSAASISFGAGFPCQKAHFDGADELLFVRRRDFARRFRVKPFENTMQVARRMHFNGGAKPCAQIFLALRNVRKP